MRPRLRENDRETEAVSDKLIQDMINEERSRCAALVEALRYDPDLILYCINSAYGVSEIDQARKRFAEFGNEPVEPPEPEYDNCEDIM